MPTVYFRGLFEGAIVHIFFRRSCESGTISFLPLESTWGRRSLAVKTNYLNIDIKYSGDGAVEKNCISSRNLLSYESFQIQEVWQSHQFITPYWKNLDAKNVLRLVFQILRIELCAVDFTLKKFIEEKLDKTKEIANINNCPLAGYCWALAVSCSLCQHHSILCSGICFI